jgi:secreted PhoX family phosphatase
VSSRGDGPAAEDEDEDQFLAGITADGDTFPLAYNRLSDDEFAGACFSPNGQTLFANIQDPGLTLAIWGPWRRRWHRSSRSRHLPGTCRRAVPAGHLRVARRSSVSM